MLALLHLPAQTNSPLSVNKLCQQDTAYRAVACRRAIVKELPRCTLKSSSASWSSCVKGPVALFSACDRQLGEAKEQGVSMHYPEACKVCKPELFHSMPWVQTV